MPNNMTHTTLRYAFCLGILLAPVAALPTAQAQTTSIGSLKIENAWSRATPRSAPVAGGYLKITNTGSAPDRLIGGQSSISGRFSIHEMAMDGGVMKMRPLANGLEIRPGASVELKPGGYHIMFEQLKGGLTEGQAFKATLMFEKAGKVELDFSILGMGATSANAASNGSGGHQH